MMKCVQLESTSFMDHDENLNDGSIFNATMLISVGHPHGERWYKEVFDSKSKRYTRITRHSDRDVVSIDISEYFPDGLCPRQYKVTLKNGNILYVPGDKFIAEYAKEG